MRPALWARRTHKWVALVVGVQALLWMLSGLYMTAISIDIIHGDHLVTTDARPLAPVATLIDPATLAAQFPRTTGFSLKRLQDRLVYEMHQGSAVTLIDAHSGERLSPLNAAMARRLAQSFYRGNASIRSAELLQRAPQEVATRPAPIWRVEFSDRNATALYLSPYTGELLAKRHDLWRWFDFLWMFHIMDYDQRTDANNTLLRVASAIGLVFAVSGVWLLFHSFNKKRRA